MATSVDQENGSSVFDDADLSHACSPCKADGKKVYAVGYCVNCEEYLCQRCFDVHLIPSVTKKHQLLDKEHIPTAVSDGDSENSSRACPQHQEEAISYHCPIHDFLGCHLCFYKHQNSCRDVLCIQEVCQNLKNTKDYTKFVEQVENFTKICIETATEFKDKLQSIESSHAKTIATIQEFKRQLLDAVDKAENDLIDKADALKKVNLRKAKELNEKCNVILQENQNITDGNIQRSETDVYVAMVKTKERLRYIKAEIESVANINQTRHVAFRANHELMKAITNQWALGKLVDPGVVKAVDHKLDINIKTETDTGMCRPISFVMCSNRLVITDRKHKSVKIIDTTNNKLASELKLSSEPQGICKKTDNEVAVAEVFKVVFVKTGLPPHIEKEFAIPNSYHGLGYCEQKRVVSTYSSSKVEVFDMQGNVLNTFSTDDQGQHLFYVPYHLTVNQDNKLIYVSNFSFNSVVCMRFDGTVVAKYTDPALRGPCQVITDVNGMVYVCGQGSNNIHQLTEDCKKIKVILTNSNGLNKPELISYDELRCKLYVGQNGSNLLKVYDVTCACL